ncbi:hypothetical protein C1646_702837 [Rhizophagus diaphanus]|nr:hypothetical protein C1646_702837 [Rhizophagus diaphanus] [Rhizophagus sp. MUCL 43196]
MIIGGYNPLYWDQSENSKYTRDSFIFSFRNKKFQTAKVGYINAYYDNAMYCGHNYGPTFGGGHDLHIGYSNDSYSIPYSYPNLGIPRNFNMEDWEVFQVIKK